MDNRIEKILTARENRVNIQKQLICKFNKTILAVRANYPGINKENETTIGIVNIISNEIKVLFNEKICFVRKLSEGEGLINIFVIDDKPMNVKELSINIEENHELGRFVDIDVYKEDGTSISRRELGHDSRRCFLCNENAHICVRQRTHREEDIINYIEASYIQYSKTKHLKGDNTHDDKATRNAKG